MEERREEKYGTGERHAVLSRPDEGLGFLPAQRSNTFSFTATAVSSAAPQKGNPSDPLYDEIPESGSPPAGGERQVRVPCRAMLLGA